MSNELVRVQELLGIMVQKNYEIAGLQLALCRIRDLDVWYTHAETLAIAKRIAIDTLGPDFVPRSPTNAKEIAEKVDKLRDNETVKHLKKEWFGEKK